MLNPGQPAAPARRAYAALPLGWAAVVLLLTLTPARDMPLTPVWELLSFDTAAHAGVFAVLAGLSWFSLRRQRRWPRVARHAGLAVLVGSTLFGGLIEVLQLSMRLGRHGEWTDLLSDTIGAAVAVGLATAWAARPARRGRPRALVFWLGLAGAGAALGPAPAPANAQGLARARHTIDKLASAFMHGRGYVKGGDHLAAAYLRGRLRELGLQPLAPNYTQPFPLDVNTFPGALRLELMAPASRQGHLLVPGRDFIASPESGAVPVLTEYVVSPLDTLIFTDSVVVRHYLRLSSLQNLVPGVKTTPWVKRNPPSAVVMRPRDEMRLSSLPPALQEYFTTRAPRFVLKPKLTASLAATQAAQPRLEILASCWPTDASGRFADQRVQLQVDAQLQRGYQTQNLAAVVRGTAQPDSFLVVSAHYDHLGMMGNKIYFPGANDNASGVALLLELAAHYARPANRPAYSVAFLLFGAEEAGLVGSAYFVAHPLIPLQRIKFLVNLDLLGTGEQGATVVNGRLLEAPYRRLVALNDAHHYLPRLAPRGRAANSDHFPFSEAGVPAFFLYTRGGSAAYHDVNDRPAALSLAGFAGAFGLVRDFLNEMGAARKGP